MSSTELLDISGSLDQFIEQTFPEIDALIDAAEEVGKSWSGSWLGYHSRVYYKNFKPPPPDAEFSQEWGLMDRFSRGAKGEWQKYSFDDVVSLIYKRANNPSIDKALALSSKASKIFYDAKASTLSIIHSSFDLEKDKFLSGIVETIETAKILDESDHIDRWRPKGLAISRDTAAIGKGQVAPPHISVLAKAHSIKFAFDACKELSNQINTLASHISKLESKKAGIRVGMNKSAKLPEQNSSTLNRLKEHWLGAAVSLVVVTSGITWTVSDQVLVRPRSDEIQRLKEEVNRESGKLAQLQVELETEKAQHERSKNKQLSQYIENPQIAIDKLLLLEAPVEGHELKQIKRKYPLIYESEVPRVLFLAVVSDFGIDTDGKSKLKLEPILENLGTRMAYILPYPERRNPDEWKPRLITMGHSVSQLEKLAGKLKGKTIFMAMIVSPKPLGEGSLRLRIRVKDLITGFSDEAIHSIEISK